jgi:uncharacterized membrane protein
MPRSYVPRSAHAARTQLVWGVALLVVGIVITAATYANASQRGGTYIISFGPIIFGALRIVTALPVLLRSRQQAPAPGWTSPAPPSAGTWSPSAAPGWPQSSSPAVAGPAGTAPYGMQAQPAAATLAGPTSAPGPVMPPPGWYPDPSGDPLARRWDGSSWTDETRPN